MDNCGDEPISIYGKYPLTTLLIIIVLVFLGGALVGVGIKIETLVLIYALIAIFMILFPFILCRRKSNLSNTTIFKLYKSNKGKLWI